jgi:hypothetical protein
VAIRQMTGVTLLARMTSSVAVSASSGSMAIRAHCSGWRSAVTRTASPRRR